MIKKKTLKNCENKNIQIKYWENGEMVEEYVNKKCIWIEFCQSTIRKTNINRL